MLRMFDIDLDPRLELLGISGTTGKIIAGIISAGISLSVIYWFWRLEHPSTLPLKWLHCEGLGKHLPERVPYLYGGFRCSYCQAPMETWEDEASEWLGSNAVTDTQLSLETLSKYQQAKSQH